MRWLILGMAMLAGVAGTSLVEKEIPENKEVRIMAVGDVMLGRMVNVRMHGRGFEWPFVQVRERLSAADLTVGNLESPLISNCPVTAEGMVFCGEKTAVSGLKMAGFDVMSMANNHAYNYGKAGFEETINILDSEGIGAIREGEVVRGNVKGLSYSMLAYDDVSKKVDAEKIYKQVGEESQASEFVMVVMHWGVEYVNKPSSRQVELGRGIIEAGADVVLGVHPHWVQPVEKYKEGLIVYSMGNFVFDQMWSEETKRGEVIELNLSVKEGVVEKINYKLLPVRIEDYGQPRFVDGR